MVETNSTQFINMKKYFSKASLVEESLSSGVNKLSYIRLTSLSKLDEVPVFKKGSKVTLIQSCKSQMRLVIRKFSS